jgi:hypothetical protein
MAVGYFMMSTARVSALGYENDLSYPANQLWNDTQHVQASNKTGNTIEAQPEETPI